MKPFGLMGIALIVLGIAALIYQGVTYTTREKVVDIGSLHITQERTRSIPIAPVFGGLALVGGIVLLAVGGKDR